MTHYGELAKNTAQLCSLFGPANLVLARRRPGDARPSFVLSLKSNGNLSQKVSNSAAAS